VINSNGLPSVPLLWTTGGGGQTVTIAAVQIQVPEECLGLYEMLPVLQCKRRADKKRHTTEGEKKLNEPRWCHSGYSCKVRNTAKENTDVLLKTY
jgi:hypothetical protein